MSLRSSFHKANYVLLRVALKRRRVARRKLPPIRANCYYCGKELSRRTCTKDHVKPLSKGGSNAKRNIVNACRTCNEEKGSLRIDEWRLVLAYRAGYVGVPDFLFPGELEK